MTKTPQKTLFLPYFGLFLAQNGTFQDPSKKSIFRQKISFFITFKKTRKNRKKTIHFLKKTSFFDRFQNRAKKGKKRGVFFTPQNPFFRGPGPSNLTYFQPVRVFRYNFIHFKTFKSSLYIKNIYQHFKILKYTFFLIKRRF